MWLSEAQLSTLLHKQIGKAINGEPIGMHTIEERKQGFREAVNSLTETLETKPTIESVNDKAEVLQWHVELNNSLEFAVLIPTWQQRDEKFAFNPEAAVLATNKKWDVSEAKKFKMDLSEFKKWFLDIKKRKI